MSESLRRLGDVSRLYEQKADECEQVYTDAARAESAYKHERAKAVIRFKESGERMSVAEAETRADASDEVAALYQDRLVKTARDLATYVQSNPRPQFKDWLIHTRRAA